VAAVDVTLRSDFSEKGLRHDDVAWRNVGFYRSDEGAATATAVTVRCGSANHLPGDDDEVVEEEDCVKAAIKSLRRHIPANRKDVP